MTRRGPAVLGLALIGAQAGHLLAYQLRFGAAAFQAQSSGAHAYFPALVKTSLGAVAVIALGSLVLVAAARVLARGRHVAVAKPSYLSLLAAVFTIQLCWFVAQESIESVVAGIAPEPAPSLLLWGMVGQLPVALAVAAALRWLWTQVEAAAEIVASVADTSRGTTVPAFVPVYPFGERAAALVHASRSPHVKRGPPISSSIASL